MARKSIETQSRSFVKALTFRVLIVAADSIIVYAITRRIDLVVTVVVLRNLAATFLYYFHERAWNGVQWGKKEKK